jgi:hypothetical protein
MLDVGCWKTAFDFDIQHPMSNIQHLNMPTPTTDFSIFDGIELVTYDPVTGSTVNNIRGVRRPLTQSRQRKVERYIELEPTDVVFHLDGGPLAFTQLVAGDVVTDAESVTYSVLFVERQTLDNSVVTVCRLPAI